MKKHHKLFTIGHSTHTFEEFIALLETYQITHLVDVRTIPKSRRVPWFNSQPLAKKLAQQKIHYTHMKELGGLRHPRKDSINVGWHNDSFRGFADYMQTIEFAAALDALNQMVEQDGNIAIMCAEAVPWRCHRSLIADAELVHGIQVFHIMGMKVANLHKMTAFAEVDKSAHPPRVFYPHD